MNSGAPPVIHIVKCPRCRTPVAYEGNPSRPFCSERCRLIDLGNWADGTYAIPTSNPNPEHTQSVEGFAESESRDEDNADQ